MFTSPVSSPCVNFATQTRCSIVELLAFQKQPFAYRLLRSVGRSLNLHSSLFSSGTPWSGAATQFKQVTSEKCATSMWQRITSLRKTRLGVVYMRDSAPCINGHMSGGGTGCALQRRRGTHRSYSLNGILQQMISNVRQISNHGSAAVHWTHPS